MQHYWTCSKFAHWLRGTSSQEGGMGMSMDAWDEWDFKARDNHPFRYWLTETVLDKMEDIFYFIPDKFYSIKYYLQNRFIRKTHILSSHPQHLKRGVWYDLDTRMLNCLFDSLVDYVEVELPGWKLKRGEKRSAALGIGNLMWQIDLKFGQDDCITPGDPIYGDPTPQAVDALEILELYLWWTLDYPNRPDIYDESGWTAVCAHARDKYGDSGWYGRTSGDTPEEEAISKQALQRSDELEKLYMDQDEEMLIRLVKIRKSLWT